MTAAIPLPAPEPARLPFGVRVAVEGDLPLIMESWLQSAADAHRHLEGRRFIKWQKSTQRGILSRPTTRALVVHAEEDPSVIMAWIVYGETSPPTVYYVWTRTPARRLGLAKRLLRQALPESAFASPVEGVVRHEPDVILGDLPPREFDEKQKRWVNGPLQGRIPRTWKLLSRVQHHEP